VACFRTLANEGAQGTTEGIATEKFNLGIAYTNLKELSAAEQANKVAAASYQHLVDAGEAAYLAQLTRSLTNLADDYHRDGKFSQAQRTYGLALEILGPLSANDPKTYGTDIAIILNSMGATSKDAEEFEAAVGYFSQSLEIFRGLAEAGMKSPGERLPLLNLATMGIDDHYPQKQARVYADQAIQIEQTLWRLSPSGYRIELAAALLTKAQLLGFQGSHRRKACGLVSQAANTSTEAPLQHIERTLSSHCQPKVRN
jgi:hypothetical protein